MNAEKRKRLEAAGWRFGSVTDFLNLTPAEESYIGMKLTLARELEAKRREKNMTQKALAAKLRTSQPRVAMMEKGDPSVSLDLLIRALLALGMKRGPTVGRVLERLKELRVEGVIEGWEAELAAAKHLVEKER